MKFHLFNVAIALTAIVGTPARSAVIVDTFSGSTLDPMWVLDDEPASYSGGGFAMNPGLGVAGFTNVGNNAFAHLRSATTYDTTPGFRADATMTQNSPLNYLLTWGMSVAIYYDADNWVAIRQNDAGGSYGWLRDVMVGGVRSATTSNAQPGLRNNYLISGIELTATQILFYGSSIAPVTDMYGVTNIDANISVIPEFTMAKPAGFTGQASLLIGKGYTGSGYPNAHFDNSTGSDLYGFTGIDYARITTVPEPTIIEFIGSGALAVGCMALRRRSRPTHH